MTEKVTISASSLKIPTLALCKYVAKPSTTLPVLTMLKIGKVEDRNLMLATNLDAFAIYNLDFPPLDQSVLVDARALARWVRKLRKDEMISLEVVEGALVLKSERFSIAFPCGGDANDYPIPEDLEESLVEVDFDVRIESLIEAAAKESERPYLNGIHLHSDGTLWAADGFSLHIDEVDLNWHGDECFSRILLYRPAFENAKGTIKVAASSSLDKFRWSNGPLTVFGRLEVDSKPDISSIVNKAKPKLDSETHPLLLDAHVAFETLRKCDRVQLTENGIFALEHQRDNRGNIVESIKVLSHVKIPLGGAACNPQDVANALAFVGHPARIWQKDLSAPIYLRNGKREAVIMPIYLADNKMEIPDFLIQSS